MENKKLVGLKEASSQLDCSYMTLYREYQNNPSRLGFYKIGRTVKLDLELYLLDKSNSVEQTVSFARLRDFYENKSSHLLTLSKATVCNHRKALSEAGKYFLGKNFSKENLFLFIDHLRISKQLTDGTIKKYLNVLSCMATECVKIGMLSTNPIHGMEHGLKYGICERYLTREERARIQNFHNTDLVEHIEFAIETGLRKQEQERLEWQHVDFEKPEIYIPKRKSGSSLTIPISDIAKKILLNRRGLKKPFRKIGHYEWKKCLIDCNVDEKVRWHDLRHTFATWCAKGLHKWNNSIPVPLDRLAMFMGHQKVEITRRYYKLSSEDLFSWMQRGYEDGE